MDSAQHQSRLYLYSIISGGIAGSVVDIALFPLDTLKTRLQSKQGFLKAGGFTKVYSGISSAIIGSAPSAALFFVTYDSIKRIGSSTSTQKGKALKPVQLHMMAASLGEVAACMVRVPTDVVKQRMQVGLFPSLVDAAVDVHRRNGLLGFYRGFQMTVFREIPFACIQFPLYEKLKEIWIGTDEDRLLQSKGNQLLSSSVKAGLCGMVAGGAAAAITTPLDVMKTRIMLSSKVCFIMKHLEAHSLLHIIIGRKYSKGIKSLYGYLES